MKKSHKLSFFTIKKVELPIQFCYNIRMQLLPFNENDYQTLYDFMKPLWLETYGPILPESQILFLLDKYFARDNLTSFRQRGYVYRKIDDVGVLVYLPRENDIYLDKLYLQPHARGKEYPKHIFNELIKTYKKPIMLNVNQANERAVRCYEKNGFTIIKKEKIDLGNGMYNVDFVMQLSI